MRKNMLKVNIDYEKSAIGILFGIFFILLAGYLYFVNAGVLSVVLRKQIQNDIATMSSRVAGLEAEYFARVEDINIDNALALGLHRPQDINYVTRKSLEKKIFTFRDDR